MFFLRRKWKEKPQCWGNYESVKSSLFKNSEKLNLDPKKIEIACPAWEKSGNTFWNYSKEINGIINGSTWERKGLYTPRVCNINDGIEFSQNLNIIQTPLSMEQYTIFMICGETSFYQSSNQYCFSLWSNDNSSGLQIYKNSGFNSIISAKITHNGQETPIGRFDATQKDEVALMFFRRESLSKHDFFINNGKTTNTSTIAGINNSGNINYYRIGNNNSTDGGWNGFHDMFFQFNDALTDDQIESLTENPYQLWQPTSHYFHHFITKKPTILSTKNSSWKISTEKSKQSIWNIKTFNDKIISWKTLTGNDLSVAYNILKKIDKNFSNRILISESKNIEFKHLAGIQKEINWKTLNSNIKESSWKIKNIDYYILSWKILFSIFKSIDTSWIIKTETKSISSWNIANKQEKQNSWKIKNLKQNSSSWKIIDIKDKNIEWSILNIISKDSNWKILNTKELITIWSLLSLDVQDALYKLVQSFKIFAINQEKRTFIFIQEKKE